MSTQLARISSKLNLGGGSSKARLQQMPSYESFSSSRGAPSPPPFNVEAVGGSKETKSVADKSSYWEYTFTFDEDDKSKYCFMEDITVPNHFRSLDNNRLKIGSSLPDEKNGLCAVDNDAMPKQAVQGTITQSYLPILEHSSPHNPVEREGASFVPERVKYFESFKPSITGDAPMTDPSAFSSMELYSHDEDCDNYSHASMASIEATSLEDVTQSLTHAVIVSQKPTNNDTAADSVLVWGLLGAVLGSPAPKAVQRKKKQSDIMPVNLWHDGTVDEDCDDLVSLSEGSDDGFVAESSLEQRLGNLLSLSQDEIDEGEYLDDLEGDEGASTDSIPSKSEIFTEDVLPEIADITSPTTERSTKELAGSTVAWAALSMLLGSPAPVSVATKTEKRVIKNLWQDERADDDEVFNDDDSLNLDELSLSDLRLDDNHKQSDDNSVPSIVSCDGEFSEAFDDGKKEAGFYDDFQTSPPKQQNDKELADTLAFTALSMLLGSPAPSSITKKDKRVVKNLWKDSCGEDEDEIISLTQSESFSLDASAEDGALIDDIAIVDCTFLGEEVVSDDISSIPSLMEGSDDGDDPPSPFLTPVQHVATRDLVTPSKDNEVTDSVIAWGMLGGLLGSPAPKSALAPQTRSKEYLERA